MVAVANVWQLDALCGVGDVGAKINTGTHEKAPTDKVTLFERNGERKEVGPR